MFLNLAKRLQPQWASPIADDEFVCTASSLKNTSFSESVMFDAWFGSCCTIAVGGEVQDKNQCKFTSASIAAIMGKTKSPGGNSSSAVNSTAGNHSTSGVNSGANSTSPIVDGDNSNATSESEATANEKRATDAEVSDPTWYNSARVSGGFAGCLKRIGAVDFESTCGDSKTVKKSAAAPGLRFGMTGTLAVVASAALAVLTL